MEGRVGTEGGWKGGWVGRPLAGRVSGCRSDCLWGAPGTVLGLLRRHPRSSEAVTSQAQLQLRREHPRGERLVLGDDSHTVLGLKKLDWRLWPFYALSVWVQLGLERSFGDRGGSRAAARHPPTPGWTGFPHNRSPPPHAPHAPGSGPLGLPLVLCLKKPASTPAALTSPLTNAYQVTRMSPFFIIIHGGSTADWPIDLSIPLLYFLEPHS